MTGENNEITQLYGTTGFEKCRCMAVLPCEMHIAMQHVGT